MIVFCVWADSLFVWKLLSSQIVAYVLKIENNVEESLGLVM